MFSNPSPVGDSRAAIFMEKVYTIKGSVSVKEMLDKTPGKLGNTHTEIDRAARKLSITLPSLE